MAKKKAAPRRDFNLSAEVREILRRNRSFTGREALEALKKKFPKQPINENTFSVAYSGARKKLGIIKGRKVRRRKPATRSGAQKRSAQSVDMAALQAARKYLAEVGDPDTAIAAIKQLQSLQIS
jgi:hypothetical protein